MIEAQIRDAVDIGADVIVLPELATSGYMFADADEARVVALTPADSAFTNGLPPWSIRLSSEASANWATTQDFTTVQ